MDEELKQQQAAVENPAAEETELPPAQEALALQVAVPTAVSMWNDTKLMNQSFRMARMLSSSALVPDSYRNSPENCVVAIDIANRMGISPLMVMQSMYVVKGKPSWSGSFCAAAVNGRCAIPRLSTSCNSKGGVTASEAFPPARASMSTMEGSLSASACTKVMRLGSSFSLLSAAISSLRRSGR